MANAFILVIPILVWNGLFYSKLPEPFNTETFDAVVPRLILWGENTSRIILFALTLCIRFNLTTAMGKQGIMVYLLGIIIYFLSWLPLIYAPYSAWSNSSIGFCAPAYTPVLWLIGIALMAESYCFSFTYRRWHFVVWVMLFTLFHIAHTLIALRTIKG